MHSISEFGSNVPAFLAKLWKMVEDPATNDLILWSPSGMSFLIRDQARFSKELLPKYYKHNNLASFIRQLNMYGFHKIVSVEAGSAKLDQDENEFHHPCFVRDHPYMLEHIKRKITTSKIEGATGKTEVVNKVLTDVRQMRNRQETMDSRLAQMKLENEALWRELAILRKKHLKQQQIVNKLIQFLVSLVQHPHNNGISVKRRNMPLMLQDKAGRRSAPSKSDEKRSFVKSPSGPVIHELDPAEYATTLLGTVEDVEGLSTDQPDQFITAEPLNENAENVLQSVGMGMASDQDTSTSDNNLSTEDFHIQSTGEIFPTNDLPNTLLLTSPDPILANPAKLHKPASKKGRSKKKKPHKYVTKNVDGGKEVASDVNVILADVTESGCDGSNNIPLIITTPATGINHITPDSFSPEVELDGTINLEDLAEICPSVNLLSNDKLGKSNNVSLPILIENQLPASGTKNNSVNTVKAVADKRYNIGKNASTLFTSKKAKLPNAVKGKKEEVQPVPFIKMEQVSPLNDVEENVSNQSPAGSTTSLPLSPSLPESNTRQNDDMTIACTTDNSNSLNRYSGNLENCNSFRKIDEMDFHIDSMQSELDSLKELLKYENLSLDANTLLSLFNNDDPMSYSSNNLDVPTSQASVEDTEKNDNNSNKITMYSAPSMLDLNDVFANSDWSLPVTSDSYDDGNNLSEDLFPEVNTPIVSLSQPSFGPPAKKRKK